MKAYRTMVVWGFACFWGACAGWAQTKQWDRRFGANGVEECRSVRPTADGGYIFAGYSDSGANGDKTESSRGKFDYWIVKVDAWGAKQWDRRFGGAGDEYGTVVRLTSDGGYIVGGSSDSGAGGDKAEGARGDYDYWILKLDANGNKQWDRRFGGSLEDGLTALEPTADGGYILGGYSDSGADGDRTESSRGSFDYWIVKVDAWGAKQWDRRFGGIGKDMLFGLQPVLPAGYILAGHSPSAAGGDKTEEPRGLDDYWIVKVDAQGAKEWDRRFGGISMDQLEGVAQTPDGGYVLGGTSYSGAGGDRTEGSRGGDDFWVVKVDAQGAKEWDRRFGGSQNDMLACVQATADGGCVLGGHTYSGAGGDVSQSSRGSWDMWIVKLSAGGTKQWDGRAGGAASDTLDDLQPVSAGYILGGTSASAPGGDKTEASRGGDDFWAVKIAAVPDAYEPDDTPGAARSISSGGDQLRSLHQSNDVDWIRFVIGSPGAHDVVVETSGPAGDTEMWIFKGGSGALVGHGDDISPTERFSRVSLATLASGTYFVKIVAYGGKQAVPAYRLRARWAPNIPRDAYEPDNSLAAARRIRSGRTQNRTIDRAGNRDWAKFTIGAAGAVNLKVETRGASGDDTQMGIYNRAGRRLFYDDDSGRGRFSRIRRSSLAAGTYYIRVQDKGNNGTIPAYTLRATWTAR